MILTEETETVMEGQVEEKDPILNVLISCSVYCIKFGFIVLSLLRI